MSPDGPLADVKLQVYAKSVRAIDSLGLLALEVRKAVSSGRIDQLVGTALEIGDEL